ncbi:GNAT family N-acetyltransferase [Nanoarchaeota archaeon]
MKIVTATKKDLDVIVDLMIQFKEYLSKFEPKDMLCFREVEKSHPKIRKSVLKEIMNPNGRFLVLKNDNEIIGFVYGSIEVYNHLVFKPLKRGVLQHLWVDKNYWGRGLSSKLKNHLFKWFKMKKCKYVVLYVLDRNPSHKIYKKWGFENLIETMVKKL